MLSASCPSRAALEVVGGTWAVLIVPLLAAQPGQSLSEALVVVDRWAERNFAAVASARMAFDRRR